MRGSGVARPPGTRCWQPVTPTGRAADTAKGTATRSGPTCVRCARCRPVWWRPRAVRRRCWTSRTDCCGTPHGWPGRAASSCGWTNRRLRSPATGPLWHRSPRVSASTRRCGRRAGRRGALARLTGLGPLPGSAPAVGDRAVVLPADLLHAFHAVGGEPAAAVEVAGAIIGVQRPEGHRRALGDVRQHRAHQLAGHATAPGGRLEVDGVDLNGGPVGVLVAAGAVAWPAS